MNEDMKNETFRLLTKANATGLLARFDGIRLDHAQEIAHPILLDYGLDDDADRHGGKRR